MVRGRRADGEDGFACRLAAAKAGEAWAAAELFHDLQPRLRRFLGAQEPRAADDLTGQVWEAVARGIGGFVGGERDLRAWVFTIARRRLVDYRRGAARSRTDLVATSSLGQLEALGSPEHDVMARLSAQEAVDLIVSCLSGDQAEVVLLRVLGDLGVAEVAEITGRSENWVRVTQHRALRRLADRVGPKIGVTR